MVMVDGEGIPLSAFATDAATSEVHSIETLIEERINRWDYYPELFQSFVHDAWLLAILKGF